MHAWELPPLRPLHLLTDGGGKDSSEGEALLVEAAGSRPAESCSWKRTSIRNRSEHNKHVRTCPRGVTRSIIWCVPENRQLEPTGENVTPTRTQQTSIRLLGCGRMLKSGRGTHHHVCCPFEKCPQWRKLWTYTKQRKSFEGGMWLFGRTEVSLAATTPCRLQLSTVLGSSTNW
jgi:hypothetical protein